MRMCKQVWRHAIMVSLLLAGVVVFVAPVYAGSFLATGQTTSYQADKNDGSGVPVDVPDDGALQRGRTLRYKLLKDGTVKDDITGLIWEVKCSSCGGLHDVDNVYQWSGDGLTDTIWDWLDDLNVEGGKGYAGHKDWRIPNVRELQSIANYGVFSPAIDLIFGPTAASGHWSSTTYAIDTSSAWSVGFGGGGVLAFAKSDFLVVRAVRGGQR